MGAGSCRAAAIDRGRKRNEEAIALSTRIARELWQRYGHHRSFYGWYLTHETRDLS
jgi:hypothetical protein